MDSHFLHIEVAITQKKKMLTIIKVIMSFLHEVGIVHVTYNS